MNQKRMKGFTLIELLAVIVILAIIALIAVPVIMNIINKANKSAFKDTAYGVIQAGELYYSSQLLEPNGMTEDKTFTLPDTTRKLEIKGDVPTGTITITKDGKVSIAVHNNRYCVTKGIEDKDVTVTEDIANCILPVAITNITLKEENIVLNKGEEKEIEVIFEPIDATNRTLNYVSSNTSVVTVDLNGKIKAVGKGTAKITVTTTDGSNISKEMNVEVQELVSGIEVTTSSVSIINGGTYQLEATVVPETANNKGLSYTSLNTSIATVSETGLITGVSGGETKVVISTTDGTNITKEIDVIVRQQATDITLDKTSVQLEEGDTITVSATVLPENTYNKELKWESLDTSIVTVSNGVITGVSNGTTKVKVTTLDGSNLSKEIEVKINGPVMTSSNACIQKGNVCSNEDILAGIKVNVKVNSSQNYNFYVISNTDSEVTLIMDRNLGGNVTWISISDYSTANSEEGDNTVCDSAACNDEGPITAVAALNERTSSWTNISERTFTVSGITENGRTRKYEDMIVTGRARLITYQEAEAVKCTTTSCPNWMYENLKNTGDDNTRGYWTSTARSANEYSAYFIYEDGKKRANTNVFGGANLGLRPVIELSK